MVSRTCKSCVCSFGIELDCISTVTLTDVATCTEMAHGPFMYSDQCSNDYNYNVHRPRCNTLHTIHKYLGKDIKYMSLLALSMRWPVCRGQCVSIHLTWFDIQTCHALYYVYFFLFFHSKLYNNNYK